MRNPERLLTWLLRLAGLMMAAAVFAVFMPRAWMAACHERLLGLGPFPAGPMIEYLARARSGFYAIAGVVLIVVSADVRRYGPVIATLAVGFIAMACTLAAFLIPCGPPMSGYVLLDAATAVPCFAAVLALQALGRRRDRAMGNTTTQPEDEGC